MKLSDLAYLRLAHQQISKTDFTTSSEMVSWLGAVQAQEYALSKWALGLRVSQLTDTQVENDFKAGRILRTHLLRPTWHFVTAQDIEWILALTAPRVHAANAYMYRQLELNRTVFNRTTKILISTLEGGKHLTRKAINEVFRKNKIVAEGPRLGYIMMNAELAGVICSGPRHGNQFTYALLEERTKSHKRFQPEDMLAELTTRYYLSRGPATLHDFSTWSGLTLAECRKGIKKVERKLKTVTVEGITYYFSEQMTSRKPVSGVMHMLPIYDEYIMGYKDRGPILEFRNKLSSPPQFQFLCTLVYDGQIIGTWRREVVKGILEIAVQFFLPPTKSQLTAFKKATERLEEFSQMEVRISGLPRKPNK